MPPKKHQLKPASANASSSLDMESEDISLETTVRTAEDVSSSDEQRGGSEKLSRQLIERKQLLHTIQLLKIELGQKNMLLDTVKADHMSQVEDLEERLNDALHQKQLLDLRLDGQLKLAQEENRKQQSLHQQEMEAVLARQQQLEGVNRRLGQGAAEVRRSIGDLDLSRDKYQELRNLPDDQISVQEHVAMRLYEAVTPLRAQVAELSLKRASLTEELDANRTQTKSLMESYEEERRLRADLELRCQRLALELADTKLHIQEGDYRRDNYPRIQRERDSFEAEIKDLMRRFETLDVTHAAVSKERNTLSKEVATLQQSLSLLQKDKEYLHKQKVELSVRLAQEGERVQRLQVQLDDAKKAREDAYEKYVASRDQYRSEYENKLKDELESIRLKTSQEIENLQRCSREMYERENRNLREARDNAVLEKSRAVEAEGDVQSRYDHLLEQFRQLQLGTEGRVAELSGQARLHAVEAERALLLREETAQALARCQAQCEKQQRKLELLTGEFYSLQTSAEKRTAELRAQNAEQASQLETYQQLEQELDQVTVQAAEVEDGAEAERVLFSYGYGANVPTTARRRLQQSVHLARRVLQLERQNTALRRELDDHRLQSEHASEELSAARQLLEQTQQPYSYLVESVRQRDAQIRALKETVASLQDSVSSLRTERNALQQVKNNMAADLERLLSSRQELEVMKQVLVSMRPKDGDTRSRWDGPRSGAGTSSAGEEPPRRSTQDEWVDKGRATVFTKKKS